MTAFARIQGLLRRTIGLDPASVGTARIESAIKQRMTAKNASDMDSYAAILDAASDELQELIEVVVVPETFFFRECAALNALVHTVNAGSLQSASGAPLCILSLPCSSGEEPFSIAMSLLASGRPPGSFRVDGVDVSREAISRARRATYNHSSLRGDHEQYMDYFIQTGDDFTVRRDLMQDVRFEVGNVLAPDFAPPHESYDAVFCRNLLIYFDEDTQRQVISVLSRVLKPDGMLFVGAVDAYPIRSSGFLPIGIAGSFAFRNTRGGISHSPRPNPGALQRSCNREKSGFDASRLARVRASTRAILRESEEILSPPATNGLPSLEVRSNAATQSFRDVARLADAGQIKEACHLGEQLVKTSGADASAFALLGTIHEAANNAQRAEECYRRALYLDPQHDDALLHLAILFDGKGEAETAARLRARARRARSAGTPS